MRNISYGDAINEALTQEMEKDSAVFIYGIDADDHKAIFGSTKGIVDKFGSDRCFSTPLSEDAMTGFGLGAAINGLRPVHIHMRVDFLTLAMNQLANMVSSYAYSVNGQLSVPLVIRAIVGRGWGQSYQHSKTLHSWFAHIPGLQVVIPTTPYDAKGLLIASIRSDKPVIFIEHRWLYYVFDDVPEDSYTVPIGQPNIIHKGNDITIIATSWLVVEAVHAAKILKKAGIQVEVIDPRTIAPLNDDSIIDSVNKTGHCIIADNDWIPYGFSAEMAACVSQKCFSTLKSPIERIGFAFTPCPSTRPLENHFYPNAVDIIRAVETKLNLQPMDLSKEDFYSYEQKFKGPF